MFLFKKGMVSTFFGLRELLLWEITSPALLKSRSEGRDVANVLKYFDATFAIVGYIYGRCHATIAKDLLFLVAMVLLNTDPFQQRQM